jgi:acyl-CoA thioesterase II
MSAELTDPTTQPQQHPLVRELIELLALETLEADLYRGQSRDIGTKYVFGGQVLGQALAACQRTVTPDRHVHSLHAYFLRAGDIDAPIVYMVDRSRDGKSFSTRRVTAIQHGQQIFGLAASFHVREPGMSHQLSKPDVPPPEDLAEFEPIDPALLANVSAKQQRWLSNKGPFEFRHVYPRDELKRPKRPAFQHVWFRLIDKIGDDDVLHQSMLAYASDFHLLGTATFPHGISYLQPNVQMASLDHAMWFHRPFRIDDWLLYSCDSPCATGARGLSRGSIYTRDGVLVASTAQEGLIRVLEE